MQERVFNLFVFVAAEYIGELGVVVHEIDGSDSDKLNFLRTMVESDAGVARRFAVPTRYTVRLDDGVSVQGLHSSVFEQMIYGGRGLEVFEDVLEERNAPSSPLVCITHVVDGVVRIDKVHDLVEPSQPLRAVLVNRFAMPDYVTLYLTDDGFDLAQLLNDDYFRAIKLLYQERLFVSAAKLLMSFIDTVAYLNEGDCQGNFQRWLDTYVAMPSLGVTADEVWEFRNSLLHMTNIDSRKVTAGKIRPLLFYIGKRRCFSIRMCTRQLELSEMIEDFAAESSLGDLIG